MSGDILQTPDAPKPQGALDNYFKITARGSTVRQEVLAGLTTFLAMVYSVIVVPGPHSVWFSGNKLAFLSHWARSF